VRHRRLGRFAARLYGALILVVVGFQLALAAGAPWGSLTMGGAFPGQLPQRMRVAVVVQALVLLVCVAIVAARAGVAFPRLAAVSRKLIWLVVGLSTISVTLNAVTRSTWERAIWLPVTLVLLACAVVVARGHEQPEDEQT
jgi:hypothetical protein